MSVNTKMKAIADEIRAVTGETDPLTLDDMAENVPKVFEAGKKDEYDAFWDAFQENGNRINYSGLFAATTLDPRKWFKPKYDIVPTSLYMFTWVAGDSVKQTDFAQLFNEAGIRFDTSQCTQFQYAFTAGKRFGIIDTRSATNIGIQIFYTNSALETIDELIVHENLSFGRMTFQGCSALKNLKVTGTIGKTGFDVQDCKKLSRESIESIINALSESTSGLTVTFSKTAVVNAFGSVDNAQWQTLLSSKPNWTISLM